MKSEMHAMHGGMEELFKVACMASCVAIGLEEGTGILSTPIDKDGHVGFIAGVNLINAPDTVVDAALTLAVLLETPPELIEKIRSLIAAKKAELASQYEKEPNFEFIT